MNYHWIAVTFSGNIFLRANLKDRIRINNQIRAGELRVIDEEGGNLGVLSLTDALRLAEEKGKDVIEISPEAVPPVAKIMDFGKWKYQESKKQKQSKSSSTETKSLQVKVGTGEHDLELKAKKASEFMREGHRVKIELFLPGRTKYLDKNFLEERLKRLLNFISENYKVSSPVTRSPKGLSLIIERDKLSKKDSETETKEVNKTEETK